MIDQIQEFYPTQIWAKAKSEIQQELSPEMFELWFKNLECAGGDENCIELVARTEFAAIWTADNYTDLLAKNVSLVCGRNMKVKISSSEPKEDEPQEAKIFQERPKVEKPRYESKPVRISTPISPKNTFENFVVGDNNEFAYSAALAVAQKPGTAFNPLFISGATGLGKTHLMQAVAHVVLKNSPEKNVVYVSSETFMNDFMATIGNNNSKASFNQKYRQADVLLIDDVQFFAKKEGTQKEFFHTFNILTTSGKQIVLSCDRPISEVANMEQRLVSRFSSGISADIQPPDYETRLAILQKKIENSEAKFSISPEAIDFVARRFSKNVRRMEGALTNLIGYASLISKNAVITLEKAQELLAAALLEEDDTQLIGVEKIQQKTAEAFRVDVEQICGSRRTANIALARQIAMYISRKITKLTYEEIGERFGGKNHATVMYAERIVEDRMKQDEDIKRWVDILLKTLSA